MASDINFSENFQFIASFGFVTTQTFDFRITFTRLRINSRKPSKIAINGSREFILTSDVLSYETVPIETFPRNIIYKITSPTKYGNIYVEGSRKFAKVRSHRVFECSKRGVMHLSIISGNGLFHPIGYR